MLTMAGMPKKKPVHLEIQILNGELAAYKARVIVDMATPKALLHTSKTLRTAATTLEDIAREMTRPGAARRRREVAKAVKASKAHARKFSKRKG